MKKIILIFVIIGYIIGLTVFILYLANYKETYDLPNCLKLQRESFIAPKIAILIISAANVPESKKRPDWVVVDNNQYNRWKEEKQIWENTIKKIKRLYKNIDVYFLETDSKLPLNTVTIKNNTVYCGVGESFTPGIIHKTLLALKYLPNYDFYIRTNLSTVVNFKQLNKYLQRIPKNTFFSGGPPGHILNDSTDITISVANADRRILSSKMKEKNLPYHGNDSNNFDWVLGVGIIISRKYAELLVQYFDNVPYILESKLADDVLLGILIGKHNLSSDVIYYQWQPSRPIKYIKDIIFHRCKFLSKKQHIKISELYTG